MLATPRVNDGAGMVRDALAGDTLNMKEIVQTLNNASGQTLTAQQITTGILLRTGAAAVTDTFPTATNLLAALIAGGGYTNTGALSPPQDLTGYSFRLKILNGNSGTLTIAAGTNGTLATDVTSTIVAAAAREYLIQITAGGQGQVLVGSTTNGSAVVTGMTQAQTQNLVVGMAVSGTGIAGSSVINSIQPGVGFTMNNNATATSAAPGVALTLAPTYTIRAIS